MFGYLNGPKSPRERVVCDLASVWEVFVRRLSNLRQAVHVSFRNGSRYINLANATKIGLAVNLTILTVPLSAKAFAPLHYSFVGAIFEDGGAVTNGFDFNGFGQYSPQPQFFNIYILTTAGSILQGSAFTASTVCYDPTKRPICAPGDNLMMRVERGIYGQPGYDLFQFATFFAPNVAPNFDGMGVLDPKVSYEMACDDSGCTLRRIASGMIRQVFGSNSVANTP